MNDHQHTYRIERTSRTETEMICSCGKYLRGKRTSVRMAYEDEDTDNLLVREVYDYLNDQETQA